MSITYATHSLKQLRSLIIPLFIFRSCYMWRHSSTRNHRICLHGNRSCDWLLMADVILQRILVAWSRNSARLVEFNWLIIFIDYVQPLKLRRPPNPTQTPKPLQTQKTLTASKIFETCFFFVEWRSVQTFPCLGMGFDAALALFRIGVTYNNSPVQKGVWCNPIAFQE